MKKFRVLCGMHFVIVLKKILNNNLSAKADKLLNDGCLTANDVLLRKMMYDLRSNDAFASRQTLWKGFAPYHIYNACVASHLNYSFFIIHHSLFIKFSGTLNYCLS